MPLDKQIPAGCSLQQPTATTECDTHITLLRKILEKCPSRDSLRMPLFHELAKAIFNRYQCLHNQEDLEEGISLCREILLPALPEGKSRRAECLNWSISLLTARYQQLDHITDLNEAITQCREMLKFSPSNDVQVRQGILLGTFITLLRMQSERLGNLSSLEEALKLGHEYLKPGLQGDEDHAHVLAGLGM